MTERMKEKMISENHCGRCDEVRDRLLISDRDTVSIFQEQSEREKSGQDPYEIHYEACDKSSCEAQPVKYFSEAASRSQVAAEFFEMFDVILMKETCI